MPRRLRKSFDTPAGDGATHDATPDTAPIWLTADHLEALGTAIDDFPPHSARRGQRYASTGRVAQITYDAAGARAKVHGTRTYDTRWHWAKGRWTPSCTCPVAPDCKHAYALACMVLLDLLSFENAPHEDATRASNPRASGRPAPGIPASSVRAPGTPVSREARAFERLRSSHKPWDRLDALADLVRGLPGVEFAVFDEPYSDLIEEPDPDLRCWLMARMIATQTGGRLPSILAPFLERADLEQRNRARIERHLAEGVAAWVAGPRLRSGRQLRLEFQLLDAAPRQVAVAMTARLTSSRIHDEPRTGTQLRQLVYESRREPGLLPADQLELLELFLDPAVSMATPESADTFVLAGAALLRVLLAVSDSPLATWSATLPAQAAARAGIKPGDGVRLGAGTVCIGPALGHPLELRPAAARDHQTTAGRPRVTLEYLMPDGRAFGEDDVVVIRSRSAGPLHEPTLLLVDGAFRMTRGDLPADLARLFAFTGGFELTPGDAATIIEPLARASPRFATSIAAHTRVHDVRPAVCLDLRDDDWLQLRAFAIGISGWRPGEPVPPGAPVFEWTPDGRWLASAAGPLDGERAQLQAAAMLPIAQAPASEAAAPTAVQATLPGWPEAGRDAAPATHSAALLAPSSPGDDIWLELPDPAHIGALAGWLSASGAASGELRGTGHARPAAEDRSAGGWLKLGPRTIEDFARAWEARPAGVEWYGNLAARRMLAPSAQLAPRLRVEPSGVDWFTVSADWEAEGLALTENDLAQLRGAGTRFVKLPSGWAHKDQALAHAAAAEAFAELGIEPGAESQRVSLWQLAHARPEALVALEGFAGSTEALGAVRVLRERVAAFKGLPRVPVPRSIKATLRSYQRDGLDFLAHTSTLGLGAVLADDMGLGKTLQALAWLVWLGEQQPDGGPSLVVCPTSVLHLWEREAQRFAPSLRVLALTAGAERHALRRDIPRHDLVVTSYALLRRDLEELKRIEWRAVILDEAQNVKNPDAIVSRAARELIAKHRLAVTGTPLENRALDLWSLLAFVNPGYLGTRAAFVRRYDRADAPPHARRLLAAKLRPVLLRRLKSVVAPELPPRIEERRDCELTTGQRKLYLAELAKGRAVLQQLAASGGIERNKISILAVLTRLRQICCHPALAGGRAALGSGKFDALFELLEPLFAEGHKVLVFSQFVECLKLIAAALRERDIPHHMLTGASMKRDRLVAAFERDPKPGAFLISLKAGGTGLNLTAASYVVLFDPWWNPAVEAQAIDRTHRIGQNRTVIAYRMLARGSIEERIWELQQRKASLVRDVLGEDGFAKSLTREDLDYLLAEV